MSLITQCPVCGTTFKVVRDQLKISEGWVRCGHCAEVFDSAPNLREVDLEAVRAVKPDSVPAASLSDPVIDFADDLPSPALPERGLQEALPAAPASLSEVVPDPAPSGAPPWDGPLLADPVAPAASPAPSPVAGVDETEPILQADHPPDFSFIAGADGPSKRYSRWARAGMALLSLVLVFLLAGQVIYQERDRLSAVDLRWRTALSAACEVLGCDVRPWRQIESIAVESSSFNKLRTDTYRLNFVITNAADVQLAKPALELTLTDGQDTVLMRRVLLPTELDAQVETISAHGEWSGSHVVSIAASSSGLAKSVAGYRLLAFYP